MRKHETAMNIALVGCIVVGAILEEPLIIVVGCVGILFLITLDK